MLMDRSGSCKSRQDGFLVPTVDRRRYRYLLRFISNSFGVFIHFYIFIRHILEVQHQLYMMFSSPSGIRRCAFTINSGSRPTNTSAIHCFPTSFIDCIHRCYQVYASTPGSPFGDERPHNGLLLRHR